jgi:hypothetical protein
VPHPHTGFAFYGIDFVLDNDWYIEAQDTPGLEEEFDFRVELHREMLGHLIDTVEEIQLKLEVDPTADILVPLKKFGTLGVGLCRFGTRSMGILICRL